MKIMYIHGLGSSAASDTPSRLKDKLSCDDVYSIDVPNMPNEAMEYINEEYNRYNPDIVIGTSLGGFYAMQLDGCVKILINPALYADKDVRYNIVYGKHRYHNKRKDGESAYTVNREFVDELNQMKNSFFNDCIDDRYRFDTYGLFGRNDEFISHYADFKKHFLPCRAIAMNSKHHISDEAIDNTLIPLINSIRKYGF